MNDISETARTPKSDAAHAGAAVLQVLPALDQGGVERGVLDLGRHMVGRGWRFVVASSGGRSGLRLR